MTTYDERTEKTLETYSEDWPKLKEWLERVTVTVAKVGYGPSEYVKGGSRFQYLVTITREGVQVSFDYFGSVNDYKYETGARRITGHLYGKRKETTPPSPILYNVLSCVRSDFYCPENFPDFCVEYGYDEDSIKAQNIFNDCVKHARKLKSVIKPEEIEAFPS